MVIFVEACSENTAPFGLKVNDEVPVHFQKLEGGMLCVTPWFNMFLLGYQTWESTGSVIESLSNLYW